MPSVWIEPRQKAGRKRWLVCWQETGRHGARGSKVCYSSAQARDLEIAKRNEMRNAELGLSSRLDKITWRNFYDEYLQHCWAHKAASTVKSFDIVSLEAFAKVAPPLISQIETKLIERWKLKLLKGLAPATVAIRIRCVKAALSYAVRMGYLNSNPAAAVKKPPERNIGRALDNPTIKKLLKECPPILARGVVFALNTGMRRGEIIGLDWSEVYRGNAIWEVHLSPERTKTKSARIVPLGSNEQSVMGTPQDAGSVFDGLTVDVIELNLRLATASAEVGRVRFHDLRHTWATRFMERTGDLAGLMQRGGWKSLNAVGRYQHLSRARQTALPDLGFGDCSHYVPTKAKSVGSRKSQKRLKK